MLTLGNEKLMNGAGEQGDAELALLITKMLEGDANTGGTGRTRLIMIEVVQFLCSGVSHNSRTHTNAQAPQTTSHYWGCAGGVRGRRARSGNTPLFPQSRPPATPHLLDA